ncbi:MAG: ParB/RepB/Spo0J family partition protein [Candidatus Moraniibacteriota bacterium]
MAQQYGLGRGLASLIPPKKSESAAPTDAEMTAEREVPRETFIYEKKDAALQVPKASEAPADSGTTVQQVPVSAIVPNPEQPRLHFDDAKLTELADSIREHGILQPLVVTQSGSQYELIAGERRFQAAKKLGLESVPVIVRNASGREKLELAIIENIQRHNLNPIEEAKAYQRLSHEFGLDQAAVAKKMGRSRSAIANTIRLLQLPVEIQRAVGDGRISEGHAKALLAIENPEKQRAVFDLIIKEELTVRETESRVKSVAVSSHTRTLRPEAAALLRQADELGQLLGTKVKITPSGKGGKISIEYYSEEELQAFFKRFSPSS